MDLVFEPCESCGRECVPDAIWRPLPKAVKERHKALGRTSFGAKGLCQGCYFKFRRGTLELPTPVPADVVAEEWNWIANPWLSDEVNAENLAPRLGMSVKALLMAVSRLRRDGLVGPARVAA